MTRAHGAGNLRSAGNGDGSRFAGPNPGRSALAVDTHDRSAFRLARRRARAQLLVLKSPARIGLSCKVHSRRWQDLVIHRLPGNRPGTVGRIRCPSYPRK